MDTDMSKDAGEHMALKSGMQARNAGGCELVEMQREEFMVGCSEKDLLAI